MRISAHHQQVRLGIPVVQVNIPGTAGKTRQQNRHDSEIEKAECQQLYDEFSGLHV
jgi:hypothetical protein